MEIGFLAAMHDLSVFEHSQPIATLAFYQGVQQHRLNHGLLLVGQPMTTMMAMVQTLYKAMACEQPKAALTACHTCRSCRWMAQNAHPGFITVSPLSLFVEEDTQGDVHALSPEQANKLVLKPASQIKVAQIRYLQQQLAHQAGQYPRMAVFCDAWLQPAEPDDGSTTPCVIPPYDVASLPAAEGQQWQPLPLSRTLFNAQSANRFLKTLEEPGPNTFFVFLAQQQDDVLPTIASRCQTVPFQTEPHTGAPYPAALAAFWDNWFHHPQHPAVGLKALLAYSQQANTVMDQVLHQTLAWCRQTQRSRWADPQQAAMWLTFMKKIKKVEEMLSHHAQDQALLSLFY
jgi:hypothetical protein